MMDINDLLTNFDKNHFLLSKMELKRNIFSKMNEIRKEEEKKGKFITVRGEIDYRSEELKDTALV